MTGLVDESQVVFNVVWTGDVFDHLSTFVASQMAHSGARYRFLANACPPAQIDAMQAFASQRPGRVVEVLEVSTDRMVRHGDALDLVLRTRDDGELFALIDPDILARGSFLPLFLAQLADHDAVTSGKEVWSDHNIRPADHPGVNGEYFFDQDGFVFGSPHLAIYRRAAVEETVQRWGVGFSSAGNDIPEAARDALRRMGRDYWIFDTAKIVNILLQAEGRSLCHVEHPDLLHIGGVSHFLAPPSSVPGHTPAWGEGADWGEKPGMAGRYAVARYTAQVIQELDAGRDAPEMPSDVDAALRSRLELVRSELIALIDEHGRPSPAVHPGIVG